MGTPVPADDLPSHLAPEDDGEPGFGEKAKSLSYGAATSAIGGVGELEHFLARTGPEMLGLRDKEAPPDRMFPGDSSETFFPRVHHAEELLGKVGIQKPDEQRTGGYRTAGDILGGFATALPGALRGGARALLGKTSEVGEAAAKAAEKQGFKVSPAQVRREGPTGQRGATGWGEHNQDLANRSVSRGTGVEAQAVTPEFIRSRLKDLGGQFDKVYKGKQFKVDRQAVDALDKILQAERAHVTGTEIGPVEKAAQDIVGAWNKLKQPSASAGRALGPHTAGAAAAAPQFFIDGEALQRLRNVLTEKARATGSPTAAHEIYDLVSEIDASVGRNHPEVAKVLEELRPKYRNALILEDLHQRGGIRNGDVSLERLGTMMKGADSSVRRSGREIDALGRSGRDLSMRALWEPEGQIGSEGLQTLSEALKTKLGIIPKALGLQSRPARAAQRWAATAPPPRTTIPALTAAGTAVRPLQPQEE